MKLLKKILKIGLILGIIGFSAWLLINIYILESTKKLIYDNSSEIPENIQVDAVMILGARVYPETGRLSDILKDRTDTAIEVYQNGNAAKILVSGDNGQEEYDEVNVVKNYLTNLGIPEQDIFLDHAGFDTYDSLVRAKKIFEVESLIVSTQKFHLPRAVFIGKKNDMEIYGVVADKQEYRDALRNSLRESIARCKSFVDVVLNADPKYLGDPIPINGDASLSFD